MRTLTNDLLQAQLAGYPTGGYQPAIRVIFTSKDGGTTYDYSFNPTVNTNRLMYVEQREERENDTGAIRLNNYDRSIPDDLTGYYVDVGWGHNTASGVRWASADGAVSPRLWVVKQSLISGGRKGGAPILYSDFVLQGVWAAVLNQQEVRLGTAPYYQDESGLLAGKTVYQCLEYLIETTLTAQSGYTFTLDAIGDQDDSVISATIPFPIVQDQDVVQDLAYRVLTLGTTSNWSAMGASSDTPSVGELFISTGVAGDGTGTVVGTPLINLNGTPDDGTGTYGSPTTPGKFETYGQLIKDLLNQTNCVLRAEAGLAFKVVWPQDTDATNETYYSSVALGHPFYEYLSNRLAMVPNHIQVFSKDTAEASVSGDWYDPDHYSSPPTYDGPFMPVVRSKYQDGLTTSALCDDQAAIEGRQLKIDQLSQRLIIPMDARVELFDRVSILDTRAVS